MPTVPFFKMNIGKFFYLTMNFPDLTIKNIFLGFCNLNPLDLIPSSYVGCLINLLIKNKKSGGFWDTLYKLILVRKWPLRRASLHNWTSRCLLRATTLILESRGRVNGISNSSPSIAQSSWVWWNIITTILLIRRRTLSERRRCQFTAKKHFPPNFRN